MTPASVAAPPRAAHRVAVVGAGPAGLFAVAHLVRSEFVERVDVFDELPAPYGLVRYGVAADHAKTKTVTRTFERLFDTPRVRFLGNVRFGTDITREDLERRYVATVFATGARADRRLDVAGEDLAGSVGAAAFVSWYSGHPDALAQSLRDVRSAVVVGAGNVALDAARILAKDVREFTATDMPDNVLRVLADSPVRDIHVLARRGPLDVKFSRVELREIGELVNADVVVDPDDLVLSEAEQERARSARELANTYATLTQWATRVPSGRPRRIVFHFWTSPVAMLGSRAVSAVQLRQASPGRPVAVTSLDAQLVVRAIGYRSAPLPGLPFDDQRATIPHQGGRILADGRPIPGQYVAGWLKRGPSGVIGTNKSDSGETVASLLGDLPLLPPAVEGDDLLDVLAARGVRVAGWEAWRRLECRERELGLARGAEAVKVETRGGMLTACFPEG